MGANKEPFLKRKNWYVSAGLTFFIYIVLLVFTRNISYGNVGAVLYFIHLLPLLGVLMIFLGLLEKKQKEYQDRERKRKRYETTMMLSKIRKRNQRGSPSPPPRQPQKKPPPQDREGNGS